MKLPKEQLTAPRVSDVLNLFFPPSPFIKDHHLELGTSRHMWYAEIARDAEIENKPHPAIADEVAMFRKFWAECKPVAKYIEEPFYSGIGVRGTPDLVAEINGRLSVVDFKPWNKNKRTQIQTAFYKHILHTNKIMVMDRYELRIDKNSYRLEQHKDPEDLRRAVTLLSAYNIAVKLGGLKNGNTD